MKEKIKLIANHCGKKNQTLKAIEELAELTAELSRNLVWNDRRKEVIEKMADVLVMLEQLKHFYSITDEMLLTEMEFKVDRTINRLGLSK